MSGVRKHEEIAQWLRERIEQGAYGEETPIESESELTGRFSVSRATVRHALQQLEAAGLLFRKQGRRSYARPSRPPYRGLRHHRVGVISYAMDYMFAGMRSGILETLDAAGFEPVLRNCSESAVSERTALLDLMRLPLDGMIIEGIGTGLPCVNSDLYSQLESEGIPIVFTDGYHPSVRAAHVVGNDREVFTQMVDHLVSLGHVNIGGVFSPMQMQGHRRFQGFVEGLRKHGLSFSDHRVIFMPFGDRQFIFDNLFQAYREGIMECTAMVCYNDILARFLETTLLRNGISVPDQMSVTGLDECDELASSIGRRLTTATHPQRVMGETAARMIIRMIETRADVENVVLEFPLVIGDTTKRRT